MPYAKNQGLRVHYQVEGKGPALVLLHGFGNNLKTWYQFGYVAALKQAYRLILPDLRGRGESDKPHDPTAYTLECHVGDVLAVLDALDVNTSHVFGYSMGGWICFGMAKHAAQRVRSLIIGGTHPYATSFSAFEGINGSEPDAVAAALEAFAGERLSPESRARLLANDLRAIVASAQDRPSLEEVLPMMRMPCLLYAGEADSRYPLIEQCTQQIPNVSFVSFPGNHVETLRRSDLVLPHISRFLQAVEAGVE